VRIYTYHLIFVVLFQDMLTIFDVLLQNINVFFSINLPIILRTLFILSVEASFKIFFLDIKYRIVGVECPIMEGKKNYFLKTTLK